MAGKDESRADRKKKPRRKPAAPTDPRLEEALRNERWDEAHSLLEQGVEPSTSRSGLYWIVRGQRSDLLRRFLSAGADPNLESSPRPLQIAAGAGWREGVDLLLDHGADPGAATMIGCALGDAIAAGHDAIAALLVRRGAPLVGPPGQRPLLPVAVLHELEETVAAMIERGADPNSRVTLKGSAEKMISLRATGNASIGQMLVVLGLSAEGVSGAKTPATVSDFVNAPAAVVAAARGWARGIEMLAAAGADLAAHDDEGRTPAAAAHAAGHTQLAERIVALGGRSEAHRSPEEELFLAVENGDAAGVRALLAAGVSPDVPDPRAATAGRTPLMASVLRGNDDVLGVLIAGGADVDRRDSENRQIMVWYGMTEAHRLPNESRRLGMTALMYAATVGHAESIRQLATAGAALDLLDDTKHSALMLAAGNGQTAAVKALIAAGAERDLRGAEKGTALYLAAANHHGDAVRALLEAGADPNPGGSGDTPLQCALVLGDDTMARDLLAAGARVTQRDVEAAAGTMPAETLAMLRAAVGKRGRTTERRPRKPRKPPAAADSQYGVENVRARLRLAADAPPFVAAANELGRQIGSTTRDERATIGGFVAHVPSAAAADLDLEAIQQQWLTRGYLVFCCLSRAGRPEKLAILPAADPLLAVAAMGTAAPNDDLSSLDIIGWLADLGARHPFVLTSIERDVVAGRFLTPPADASSVAQELSRLCPDTLDQGSGDLEDLATELAATGRFGLWWD